jgi:hypothetical protein
MLRVILAVLFPSIVFAQDLGPSYLGLCSKNWSCKRTLSVFEGREVAATGWLIATFGDSCPCAKEFLSLPQPKIARIHIANCTCFPERGRRCGKNEPFRGESIRSADRKLKARNGTLLKRFRRNLSLTRSQLEGVDLSSTSVYLSPCLESMFSGEARRVMLDETAKAFPEFPLVDNPVGAQCLPGYICEKHGVNPSVKPPCFVDTDGDNYIAIPPVRRRDCIAQFYWAPWMNLISGSKFVDPLKRTAKPSRRDIRDLKWSFDWP